MCPHFEGPPLSQFTKYKSFDDVYLSDIIYLILCTQLETPQPTSQLRYFGFGIYYDDFKAKGVYYAITHLKVN